MLARHTLLYLPAQILSPAVQFVSVLVWAHLLSPQDLGFITLAIASQEIAFASIFMWWSHYALRYITSFAKLSEKIIFLENEKAALVFSFFAFSVIYWFVYLLGGLGPTSIEVTCSIYLFMGTRSITNYFAERARAEAKIGLYSFAQISSSAVGFVLGLILMHWLNGVVAVFLGFFLAQSITILICIIGLGLTNGKLIFHREIMVAAIKFGGPVMIGSVAALIFLNSPRFVVQHSLGMYAAGIFALGYGLGIRCSSFAVMLVTAGAYPLAVKKMQQEGRNAAYLQLRENAALVCAILFPLVFGAFSINTSINSVLIASEYRSATLVVFPWAIVFGLFRFLRSHTVDQVFLLNSSSSTITKLSTAELCLGVFASYFGVKIFGLSGAIVGPALIATMSFFCGVFIAKLRFQFDFPIDLAWRSAAPAIVMGGLLAVTPVAENYLSLFLKVVLGCFVYLVCLMFFMPALRSRLIKKINGRIL